MNNQSWHFGNFWTDDIGQAHELQIIQAGPDHKWWTSARLLLGLDEEIARKVHYQLNHETVCIYPNTIEIDNSGNDGGYIDVFDESPQEPINYIDKLLASKLTSSNR